MSRTRLTVVTALGLVVLSAAVFAVRRATGGADEVGPPGSSAWAVTLTATGKFGDDRRGYVSLATPPDFRRQHISEEDPRGDNLDRREGRGDVGRGREVRDLVWKRPAMGAADRDYRVTYTFHCVLGTNRQTTAMRERTRDLDGPPTPGTDATLKSAPRIESDHPEVAALARDLAGEMSASGDQMRAFYDHVVGLPYLDTGGGGGALDCLRAGGDDAGRSRLLVALCRSRGVPARVVTGAVLNPNAPPALHRWAEAWVRGADGPEGHWLPADPTYEHFGAREWPANYLVLRLDDEAPVRGPGAPKVGLFSRPLSDKPPAGETPTQRFWRATSFAGLPPSEQQLVRFLLLLPFAGLVVCVWRVVVGIPTYGIFSPALLGLIFRDLKALPWGLGIFVAVVMVGWVMRRVLDRFHLLLIPRAAVLLTCIVGFLAVVIVAASRFGVGVTTYVALFPLIILTHMVERFWTVEAEDGLRASFRTLLGTVVVSASVALALSPGVVNRWVFHHPEGLGVVVAALLLLGRYTGYRITELYRFQDVIQFQTAAPPGAVVPPPSIDGEAAKPADAAGSVPAPVPVPEGGA